MSATDLVLKRQSKEQERFETYSVNQSPVWIKAHESERLLGLVEWCNNAWVIRRLSDDLLLLEKTDQVELTVSEKPLQLQHSDQSWSISLRPRRAQTSDFVKRDPNAQPRRQIVLVQNEHVLFSDLLPVEEVKCHHPWLKRIELPALLDEQWVSAEIAPGIVLKSRIVFINDPVFNREEAKTGFTFGLAGVFLLLLTFGLLQIPTVPTSAPKALAPAEVGADRIAEIREAMARPEASSNVSVADTSGQQAEVTKEPARPKDARLVKVNAALSKLMGSLASVRSATTGGGTVQDKADTQATGATASGGTKSSGKLATLGGLTASGLGNSLKSTGVGKVNVQWLEEEAIMEDGLDRDTIARIIRSHLGEIRYCYERQLSASPDLEGKVQVRFVIGGQGNVVDRKVNQSTLQNGFVEGCILQKVASWTFPKTKGGVNVAVTYPFLFRVASE